MGGINGGIENDVLDSPIGRQDLQLLPEDHVIAWGAYPLKTTSSFKYYFGRHIDLAIGFGPTDEDGPGPVAMGLYELVEPLNWHGRSEDRHDAQHLSATVFGSRAEMTAFLQSRAGKWLLEDGIRRGLDLTFRAGPDFVLPQGARLVFSRSIGSEIQYQFPTPRSPQTTG